jgi:copper homeostasis protein
MLMEAVPMIKLELAALSLDDLRLAEEGGADSVELSYNLAAGGLTPSLDLVREAREHARIDLYVMVRPTVRSFVYTNDEIAQIEDSVRWFRQFGVTGIVFGAQTESGRLDVDLIARIAALAAPIPITLHRAIDTCANPVEALRELTGIIPRVLTSGPAENAWSGRFGLRAWVQQFGDDMRFVASGGIKLDQAGEIARISGAHELHIGGAVRVNGRVDPRLVRQFRHVLDDLSPPSPESADG